MILGKYIEAVAKRKSQDPSGRVNIAILACLEGDDVPRLLEIIRIQDEALRKIAQFDSENPTATEDDISTAKIAVLRTESIASEGSTSRWGGPEEKGNGQSPQ